MSQKASYTLKGLRRECSRKEVVPAQGNHGEGMRTVPDGYETADAELTVDVEALARRLGVKAMKNKGGRATIAWGLIVVRIPTTSRKRIKG